MAVARKYPKRLPIVVVEWTDAASTHNWLDWQEHLGRMLPAITVGMLGHQDKRSVTVIQSAGANADWAERQAIPRAWIKRIRRIGSVELPK